MRESDWQMSRRRFLLTTAKAAGAVAAGLTLGPEVFEWLDRNGPRRVLVPGSDCWWTRPSDRWREVPFKLSDRLLGGINRIERLGADQMLRLASNDEDRATLQLVHRVLSDDVALRMIPGSAQPFGLQVRRNELGEYRAILDVRGHNRLAPLTRAEQDRLLMRA